METKPLFTRELAKARSARANSPPITMERLCAAVDAVPGARLSTRWSKSAGDPQLGVEVHDPAADAWRVVVTIDQGKAWVERDDLENRDGVIFRAIQQLSRLVGACLVTEEGAVLTWDGQEVSGCERLRGAA